MKRLVLGGQWASKRLVRFALIALQPGGVACQKVDHPSGAGPSLIRVAAQGAAEDSGAGCRAVEHRATPPGASVCRRLCRGQAGPCLLRLITAIIGSEPLPIPSKTAPETCPMPDHVCVTPSTLPPGTWSLVGTCSRCIPGHVYPWRVPKWIVEVPSSTCGWVASEPATVRFPHSGPQGPSPGFKGKRIVTVVPCPSPSLATAIVPPCASTIARVMANPRPVPPIPPLRDWSVR